MWKWYFNNNPEYYSHVAPLVICQKYLNFSNISRKCTCSRPLWSLLLWIFLLWRFLLKLVSTIFYQFFIFSPNDSLLKTEKYFLFHLKGLFHFQDIQIFVIFYLPFHTSQIQKYKWNWNNLWCHDLTCINLQM